MSSPHDDVKLRVRLQLFNPRYFVNYTGYISPCALKYFAPVGYLPGIVPFLETPSLTDPIQLQLGTPGPRAEARHSKPRRPSRSLARFSARTATPKRRPEIWHTLTNEVMINGGRSSTLVRACLS